MSGAGSPANTDPGSALQRNVERAGFRLAYTKVTLRSNNDA